MVYQATKAIAEAMEKKGLKYETNELSSSSNVSVGFRVENGPSYKIRFISSDDDNDVSVRVYSLVKVPDNKVDAMLVKLNQLNNQYRFIRFSLDKDNEVQVSHDMPMATTNPGDIAVEITIRMAKILDDVYPEMMKALWS